MRISTDSALIAGASACVIALAVLLFFLVVQPRRRRRPLIEALAILESDRTAAFERAEDLLRRVLESGVRRRDLAEARFARTYVLARLGRYREAAGIGSDLLRARSPERESVFLALWISCKLDDHDAVLSIYDQHAAVVSERPEARLIASISLLERARAHWRRREIDAAKDYFEKIQRLEVLADRIPGYIEDHQLTLGTIALFDEKLDEARDHFRGFVKGATDAGRSPVLGELGLLLVRWRDEEQPDVDEQLGAAADLACRTFPLPPLAPDSGDGHASESDSAPGGEVPLSDEQLIVRGTLLWHVMSLLRQWQARPRRSGLSKADIGELHRRAERVRTADPAMSDPWLIEGLVSYHAASGARRRAEAVALLERGQKHGLNLPEVLEIIHRERQLQELTKNALEHYLTLVRSYLANPGVPVDLREELRTRLARFEPFRQTVELELLAADAGAAPSVADIQARVGLIRGRIEALLQLHLDSEQALRVRELLDEIREKTTALSKTARDVDEVSGALMGTTGEFLLRDEEMSQADPGSDEVVHEPTPAP
jgi:tetratricopeptide (TPR) repeat protein